MTDAKAATLHAYESRYCIHCGYPLRGLSEHGCPECGKRFDPTDLSTTSAFADGRFSWPHWMRSHAMLAGVLAMGGALCFSPLAEYLSIHYRFRFNNGPFLIAAFASFFYVSLLRRPMLGWHTGVALLFAVFFLALYFVNEFYLLSYDLRTLLPLVCPLLMFALSGLHLARYRPVQHEPSSILLLMPAALGWAWLAVLAFLIFIGGDTNPIDYWTHWVWFDDRW